MRRDAGSGLQFRGRELTAFPLDPQRAHLGSRLILQSSGEVDDGAAGVAGVFPALARGLLVRGEESEIDVIELLRAHALDERDLVAHGLELAKRFVVIEQANIDGGKIALVQHLGDFLALERGGADNRDPVKTATRCNGMTWGYCLDGLAHEGSEASWCGGEGGTRLPRKIHCRRQKTPRVE